MTRQQYAKIKIQLPLCHSRKYGISNIFNNINPMQVYDINNGNLSYVKEIGFNLEKDMQKLIENNLQEIFGLEFICTEFQLNNLRIDTLAFDQENNSFVIIEYKRGSSYSVIDQGFSYLSLALNNKADFVQELGKNKKKFIDKTEIDWSQTKVIFIADSFTRYQKESINFKDLPIELYECKRFNNNTVVLNGIKTSENAESIKTVTKFESELKEVNKEIVIYNEDYHTNGKSESIVELYLKLKQSILEIDGNFEIVYRKMYIAFRLENKNVIAMHLFVNSINIWLYGKYGTLDDKYGIIKNVSNIGNYGNSEHEIKLSNEENFLKVLELIKQTHNNVKK